MSPITSSLPMSFSRSLVVPLVELQRLVLRARCAEEVLAAAGLRGHVQGAVQNEYWERDQRKRLLQPLVGADHLRQGLRRLPGAAHRHPLGAAPVSFEPAASAQHGTMALSISPDS